ncbi:unnamed protein product [Rangifer tarandus platyrhynchus]|uniref:Uncharacterized protein n=1 Tax=Rangifer tarandus platyrhynchus TaxID=3082113 RepID=A0ACB1KE33_RANTA
MAHKVPMDTVRIITSSVSGMSNGFWERVLCCIMETDYTEALTPICGSLTNLAENQLHAKDEQANASKSRHVDLPAPQKLLARLLVSGSRVVHWPGPHCVLRCPSHELLIPGASRGSRELDAWQDRAFQAPIVPLGRYGKGSRLPDFSAGPLNGPKHPQDSVSNLPFPGGQLRPAPCILLLVLTLLQAPWNPGWEGAHALVSPFLPSASSAGML